MYIDNMKKIEELLGGYHPKKKPAPHELSATVNEIEKAGLFTSKYGRPYWLGKVSRAGVSFGEMEGILKDIAGMGGKYNKGGRLTNLLTERAKARKK